MLGVLPPAYMSQGYFLVGEPLDHHATTGQPRFEAYGKIGNRFIISSRAITIKELKELLS